jgi:hypothetical protein
VTRQLEPPVTDVSEPFWEATRSQNLILQWCLSCAEPVWYPREVCPRCLTADLEWRPASGRGEVHAFVVEHREPYLEDAPYVVALVSLDEGVRMMTNIVGCPTSDVRIGQPVTVTWEPLSDGRNLPLFTPA